MSSLENIGSERDRFQEERRAAEDELVELQRKFQEEMSKRINKLQRLRRQEDILKKKVLEILEEGHKLDQLEEKERVEEEQQRIEEKQARLALEINANMEASASFDWSAEGLDLGVGPLLPATLAALEMVGQDSGGETS
ncbi:hypothetical protein DL768_010340 [Monosporascus sp. mg162]|nr:hypothetical protein DL768_010340 [Monosporascus sp. mg162]